MEDFSQLCSDLRSEYTARSIPFSLRDYARMCLESLADLISEDRPEQFHSALGHFFAALYGGNDLFNRLPVPSRDNLNSMTIGIPPRRLFELLNDFARVINELSLQEMSSKTVRSSLQENGFPYRPNEFFSLLEQFEQLDQWLGNLHTDAPKKRMRLKHRISEYGFIQARKYPAMDMIRRSISQRLNCIRF